MKIKSKTLMVTLSHDVTVANGNIEATFEHPVFVYEGKHGKIDIDIDFPYIKNLKFMGVPVEDGYKGLDLFKTTMLALGVNVDKIFDEKAKELITDEDIEELKRMYRRMLCYW